MKSAALVLLGIAGVQAQTTCMSDANSDGEVGVDGEPWCFLAQALDMAQQSGPFAAVLPQDRREPCATCRPADAARRVRYPGTHHVHNFCTIRLTLHPADVRPPAQPTEALLLLASVGLHRSVHGQQRQQQCW